MSMINEWIGEGRLGADPDLKKTQNGVSFCQFSIAVNRKKKNQDDPQQTDWFDCVAWKQSAEYLCRYAQKGSLVTVRGPIRIDEWTDRNGNLRPSVQCTCYEVYVRDRKKGQEQEQSPYTSNNQYSDSPTTLYRKDISGTDAVLYDDNGFEICSDELPF